MNIIIALREQLESVYYEDLFDMSDSDLIRYEDHKKIYNKSTKRIIEKKNKWCTLWVHHFYFIKKYIKLTLKQYISIHLAEVF